MINNYTRPTEGMRAIEMDLSYDSWMGQTNFNEQIKILSHLNDMKFFIDYGNVEAPKDNRELLNDELSKNDLLEIMLYLTNMNVKEIAIEKRDKELDRADLLIEFLDEYDTKEVIEKIPNKYLKVNYADICGYSQGDYARVFYYKKSHFEKINEWFTNLFYDSPLYFNLELDDNDLEIYYTDVVDNGYEYDKETFLTALFKLLETRDIILNEAEKEFITENIPDEPKYD